MGKGGKTKFVITDSDMPKHSMNQCEDRDERCPSFARGDGCTTNPGWMVTFCPKSCNACDIRDPKVRCTRQYLNVTDEPIYENGLDGKPGSLAKMFSSIEERFSDR